MADTKLPPHNLSAERELIGCVIVSPAVMRRASGMLSPDDFFAPAHREIWSAMLAIHRRGHEVDIAALEDELRAARVWERLEGGLAGLAALADEGCVPALLDQTAGILRSQAGLRRLIAVCQETAARAYACEPFGDLIEQHAATLTQLATGRQSGVRWAGDIVQGVMDEIETRSRAVSEGRSVIQGVRFGVRELDALTCGVRPPELVVVAADPGGGKTALAQQAAALNCIDGEVSFVANLEMSAAQLIERTLVHLGKVNSNQVRRADLTYDDWARLTDAQRRVVAMRLAVDDRSRTFRDFAAKSREVRAAHATSRLVLVFDYLQLALVQQARGETRSRAVGEVARAFKDLLGELNAVGILVSQLDREPAKQGKPPTMHNLRDSGEIEQAADLILLIHNPSHEQDGTVELIVAKARNGIPTCTIETITRGRFYEFGDGAQ